MQIIKNNFTQSRLEYIDLTKLFAIYCVLWGHSLQYMSVDDFTNNNVAKFIYSFHMPLFMVLSGYFFSSSLKLTFVSLIVKKARQLVLPIFSWTIFIEIMYSIGKVYNGKNIAIIEFLKNLFLNLDSSFWFLKSLFFCYILAYIFIKLIKGEWLACFGALLLCSLHPNVFQLGFMLPFFFIGIFVKKYFQVIEKHNKLMLFCSFLVFAIMQLFWKGNYMIYFCKIPAIYDFKVVSYSHRMCVAVFRFIIGTAGSVFFILLFRYVCSNVKMNFNLLSILGQYTLGIYIVQCYLLVLLTDYLFFPPLSPILYNFVLTPITALILLSICLSVVKFIQRNKYISFLFLGNPLKVK